MPFALNGSICHQDMQNLSPMKRSVSEFHSRRHRSCLGELSLDRMSASVGRHDRGDGLGPRMARRSRSRRRARERGEETHFYESSQPHKQS